MGARGAGRGADGEPANRPTSRPTCRNSSSALAAKDDELRATIARYREASAEFEQARARIRRDVARKCERGTRAVLADLLDVLDNLDRAIEAARARRVRRRPCSRAWKWCARSSSPSSTATACASSRPRDGRFDPSCHEAATTVPVTDPAQDGIVVGVIRQGYAIGDDVLRPAVVAVATFTNEGVPS